MPWIEYSWHFSIFTVKLIDRMLHFTRLKLIMNTKYIILFSFLWLNTVLYAQRKDKPQLVVYGQGEVAFGAAVQSAKSGVQTLWVNPKGSFESELTQGADIKKVTSYQSLDGGLWGEFLKATINASHYTDSVFNRAKRHLNPRVSMNAFEKIIDSTQNLTILYNSSIEEVKRSRKNWTIDLSNGSSYKVFAVVDASKDAELIPLIELEEKIKDRALHSSLIGTNDIYESTAYKTSLMIDDRGENESLIPSSIIITPYAKNLFIAFDPDRAAPSLGSSVEDVPRLLLFGQAMGAAAGYCAFFETDYDKINIRTLQGELLAFKAQLIPFHDIAFEDVHNTHIQHIGLSGILEGVTNAEGKFIFNAEGFVSTKEIEAVMRSIYTRSQIWFNQHSSDQLKVKEVIDLIKFIALKGDEIDRAIENGWNTRFKFSGSFDSETPINRRQFAVLVDTYLQPFTVKVNKEGKFVY